MLGDIAGLILFDDKNELSLQVRRRNGGIRAAHRLALGILEIRSLDVNARSDWKKGGLALAELKHKPEEQI